ncbi:MAG TPA: ATP-binding cassette domain-containing protein [Clostridia bacterium]|nr:ATP-binding cassette domain-containing protein [Clostridia bacterium]
MRVELINLKRYFNEKKALDIDRLLIESGKVYAVLGPNGSGKSTMLRILAGFDRDFSGSVCYNGMEKLQYNCISYMPQSIYMFDFTVLENVLLGFGRGRIDRSDALSRVKAALGFVGMDGFSNAKARSLSGGEAQRVALARTLVLGRDLVLLDEPSSATDITGVGLAEKYIRSVNSKDGSTIVFTTHNPSQAARIADEVIMMHSGRIVEIGSPQQIFDSPKEQETRDFLRNWRI